MRKIIGKVLLFAIITGLWIACNEDLDSTQSATSEDALTLIDVAQTSGQLASGSSFKINGSSTDSTASHKGRGHKGHHDRRPGILDGVNLLAPTNELLAIVDAESASDFRGLRISKNGGATITHYDAAGNIVTFSTSASAGPNGCSFSGGQFPYSDSLLPTITKTVIDFGEGTTFKRDTVTITRSGKIIITRSGDSANLTEITSFENYAVNGNKIAGTKTRASSYDENTGLGISTTSVSDGTITFSDGTLASWTSDKKRVSDITYDENGHKAAGEITTEVSTKINAADGSVIFSHTTTEPLIENLACEKRRNGPVSGTLETVYREDTIVVDYGDGSCDNRTITVTINGVSTTKAIGK
jgi:hypothetical protein